MQPLNVKRKCENKASLCEQIATGKFVKDGREPEERYEKPNFLMTSSEAKQLKRLLYR